MGGRFELGDGDWFEMAVYRRVDGRLVLGLRGLQGDLSVGVAGAAAVLSRPGAGVVDILPVLVGTGCGIGVLRLLAARPRIHTFLATSPIHMKHKLNKEPHEVLDAVTASVALARDFTDQVIRPISAQIERKILESRQFDKFSSRKLGNYKEYEKKMWGDLIARGAKPPGELERYHAARKQMKRNVRVVNFTGDDPAYKLHAATMTEGIVNVIKEDQRQNGNPGVAAVFIDYAGAAAVRHLSANPSKDASREMRHLIGRMPLDAKVNICAAMRTHAWIVNQLSTEANSRAPGTAMKITDGAEARNFPEHCDFAFLVGTKTDDGLAVITAAKQRREEKKKDSVIRVDGRFCAVRATDNEFLIENNRIVSAKEFSRVADADDGDADMGDDDGDYGAMA